jgi:hypothetical protein
MKNQAIIFQGKNGGIELKSDSNKETVWANLDQISILFGRDKSSISKHISNIYKEGELSEKATVAKIATVQKEGKREVLRKMDYYNLDLIISVGYRVNSKVATEFRKWATKVLKEHVTKGFTINKKVIQKNHQEFLEAIEMVKRTLPAGDTFSLESTLDLVKLFANTWFSFVKRKYC